MSKKSNYNVEYNKKHYVRIPLDVKVSEYNALKEFCSEQKIGINTFIRNLLNEAIPKELLEKHKDDTEKD